MFIGFRVQVQTSCYIELYIPNSYWMWPGPYVELGSRKSLLASLDQIMWVFQITRQIRRGGLPDCCENSAPPV